MGIHFYFFYLQNFSNILYSEKGDSKLHHYIMDSPLNAKLTENNL